MTAESGRFSPHSDWKMHVYSPARGEWSACPYYRVQVPLFSLAKLGLAGCFMDRGSHHFDPKVKDEQSLLSMITSDVDLFYATDGENGRSILETLKGMNAGTIGGKLIYPPSAVYDIDDNLDWVHPYNPTFAIYGVRGTDGTLLRPGDNVATKLADGRNVLLWQDGVTQGEKQVTFDIKRNHAYLDNVHQFAAGCDGFTSPSRHLLKYMQENHGYPEGYVYPNSVIPEDWFFPKFAPRKKKVRILWQGGGSHMSDWFALRAPVQYIAKKYPHVTFVLFGSVFNWISDAIPEKQLEIHPWVPFEGYRATRAMMDCDINLCVLRDDEFSRSKSAIKFYEGSLGHAPEATLAPDMPPYNEEIVDGETGLLYEPDNAESFAANLQTLIENVELRRKVAENAQKWVLTNRHYMKTGPGLYEYYHELRLKKMKDKPYDPAADTLPPRAPKPKRAVKRKPPLPVRKKK